MSKELEMVRAMINGANEYEKKTGDKNPPVYFSRNNLLIIEQALNRLESIDNANPSEALAYIDAFINENNNDIKNQDITGFDIDTQAKWVKYLEHKSLMLSTIKQALLKEQELEKENKLLKEIIKRY